MFLAFSQFPCFWGWNHNRLKVELLFKAFCLVYAPLKICSSFLLLLTRKKNMTSHSLFGHSYFSAFNVKFHLLRKLNPEYLNWASKFHCLFWLTNFPQNEFGFNSWKKIWVTTERHLLGFLQFDVCRYKLLLTDSVVRVMTIQNR